MASRNLLDLTTDCRHRAERLLEHCDTNGLDLLIYCTWRPLEEQAKLYRNGRNLKSIQLTEGWLRRRGRDDLADLLIDVGPQMGRKKLTNAGPGMSAHNYGEAIDAVPMLGGRPLWKVWNRVRGQPRTMVSEWEQYGRCADEAELSWSGNWTRFVEYAHSQVPGFEWRDRIETFEFRDLPKAT